MAWVRLEGLVAVKAESLLASRLSIGEFLRS